MGTLQISSKALPSFSTSFNFNHLTHYSHKTLQISKRLSFSRGKIRAVGTISEGESQAIEPEEPPSVAFAFVSSVLLPDGTPDVHFRKACGGQKLRNIMLDSNIELYGPYIIQGEELLNPRTDREKEKLKKKRKNWRLACQTTVGKPDSTGLVVVQQLPEWKGHEWRYEKISPDEFKAEIAQLELGSESSN
ncbi:photosynthetic NDH subunit of subcomplex B 3, chloroplastic isoform X2 [Juglans microcarpa x Juglans regia]|uniref:photosynthetic NDH subunit of subcomplex B 3, chloroplastic isoform X2 n=1 Tax=Juglans microcarpa x Juglans regia TaxID=2249226 RepID=UPI001B7F0337|nr:photosynthetic NDH subunit of subcomplex B 3, chloroplastic isoform X2 [Juglans microcarpa x Juglans regia]